VAIRKGYGVQADAEHCEESGHFEGGDYSKVSPMAKKRGMPQFGTLGSGNHFCEVQRVDKIFDAEIAKAFGITGEGQVTVMIHSGSRATATRFATTTSASCSRPPRDTASASRPRAQLRPPRFPEAQDYLAQMRTAINFAFNNST